MRFPFLTKYTLLELSAGAIKSLFLLASRKKPGYLVRGLLIDDAATIGCTAQTLRRYLDELEHHDLIEGLEVTTSGYKLRVAVPRRFTWVPSFRDDRLMRLTPQACKAFLTICRALSNKSRTIRMQVATIARRIGRGMRVVQLCLNELRDSNVLESWRTGRSNIYRVIEPENQERFPFRDCIAHRSRTLLRIVESTPPPLLNKTLGKIRRRVHNCVLALLPRPHSPEFGHSQEGEVNPTTPSVDLLQRDEVEELRNLGFSPLEIMETVVRLKPMHLKDIGGAARRRLAHGL